MRKDREEKTEWDKPGMSHWTGWQWFIMQNQRVAVWLSPSALSELNCRQQEGVVRKGNEIWHFLFLSKLVQFRNEIFPDTAAVIWKTILSHERRTVGFSRNEYGEKDLDVVHVNNTHKVRVPAQKDAAWQPHLLSYLLINSKVAAFTPFSECSYGSPNLSTLILLPAQPCLGKSSAVIPEEYTSCSHCFSQKQCVKRSWLSESLLFFWRNDEISIRNPCPRDCITSCYILLHFSPAHPCMGPSVPFRPTSPCLLTQQTLPGRSSLWHHILHRKH